MALFAVLLICVALTNVQTLQNSGGMPIVVKDKGVVELKKNEVAMVFYVTVTNTGLVPIYLSVNGTKCCQTITHDDEDCLSMKLLGGEMGELFPQDSRNLTLLYVNLLPHNRVGYCDVIINDNVGRSMTQNIKFNTTLVKGDKVNVPRLLQSYYDSTVFKPCDSVDKDPLNLCKPYNCYIRYDGQRSRWNYTSERCEKIPSCMPESENDDLVAYNVDSGTCVRLKQTIRDQDYAEFKEGKPSILTLAHEHGYPVNIRCHNGKEDKTGHWCECNKGWVSAPFDQKYFNPDIQVYHMCTVWTGKMTAEEARNITVLPKPRYKTTNIVIVTVLALFGIVLLLLIAYVLHKMRLQARAQAPEEEEMEFLRKNANGSSE